MGFSNMSYFVHYDYEVVITNDPNAADASADLK